MPARRHGGPCAILAAAQAFTLRRLLFDPTPATPTPAPTWLPEAAQGDDSLLASDEQAWEAFLRGLTDVLCNCATAPEAGGNAAGGSACDSGSADAAELSRCAVVLAVPSQAALSEGGGGLLASSREALLAALVGGSVRPVGWMATLEALRSLRTGLASPIGALSVLVSALLTRGVVRFSRERDDATQPLLDPQVRTPHRHRHAS